jgi:hypothetical protein
MQDEANEYIEFLDISSENGEQRFAASGAA